MLREVKRRPAEPDGDHNIIDSTSIAAKSSGESITAARTAQTGDRGESSAVYRFSAREMPGQTVRMSHLSSSELLLPGNEVFWRAEQRRRRPLEAIARSIVAGDQRVTIDSARRRVFAAKTADLRYWIKT
jgi:hypothetical protein